MASILSACIVLYHCGDELTHALGVFRTPIWRWMYIWRTTPRRIPLPKRQWLFPGVTVLSQKGNIGFGRANNAVLPYLQSKYHLIMNPDVTFDPSLLSRMISYMEAHPNIAVLTPRVMNEDGTEQFLPKKRISVHYLLSGLFERFGGVFRRWRNEFTMADLDVVHPVPVEFATGCFLFIRTEIFKKLNGFDPRFFLYQEDSDLSRRVLEENLGSIVYHPDMRITHQWARENTRTFKGRMRQVRSVIKYFLKWGVTW